MAISTLPKRTTQEDAVSSDQTRILDHLRTHVRIVTPAQAREILEHQNWSRQRDLRRSHVTYLVSCIERGELTELSLIFAEMPSGQKLLVDGQHRLTALVQTDKTLPATVTIHRVNDEHDLARLYAKIDRQSTRTPEAILRAFGIEDQANVSPTILKRIGRAVPILEAGFAPTYRQNKSLIARSEAVEKWLPYGELYASYVEGATSEVGRLLWRAPVAAVGIATARYQPSTAEQFWSVMAQEDGLVRTDPRARLLAWLRSHRIGATGEIIYARHVAGAWNAAFEGRSLERLMLRDPSTAIWILGTPFKRDGAR